jgi:hypothetical protein
MNATNVAISTSVPAAARKVQPIRQRIGVVLRDHRRFALHDRHRLAIDHLVCAGPVEVPHRKAKSLGCCRAGGPIQGSGHKRKPAWPHRSSAVMFAGGFTCDMPCEVAALSDQYRDDKNPVSGIGAPHPRTGIAPRFRRELFSAAKASLGFQNLSSSATEAS